MIAGSHARRHTGHTRRMLQRPCPPFAPADRPLDRTVAPRAYEIPYGEGVFRRRIRLANLSDGHTAGELEDDFHHFRIDLTHDGERIVEAEGLYLRGPWTTCAQAPDPLRSIVGGALSPQASAIGAYAPARENCTHLFDLAGLAVAHATRSAPVRQYDIELTDPRGPADRSRASLWRDGGLIIEWQLEHREISEPPAWQGAPLRNGFIAWAQERFDTDMAEAAIALRRIVDIAIGRSHDLDAAEGAAAAGTQMLGKCHSFQPGVVELGRRNHGSARYFEHHPEMLLGDMHLRDAR
jgi:hypothetical protein